MTLLLALALTYFATVLWSRYRRRRSSGGADLRLVMLLLLVELRSGASVLGALSRAATMLPDEENLGVVARVAAVSGLTRAVELADDRTKLLVSNLARAQRSGASLTATVRRLIEQDLASERTLKLARARSLPVRLMIPITLLMLPGLILMVYGLSLLGTVDGLMGSFG